MVDFWKGPVPVHEDPEVSALEEDRADYWGCEGEDARIIRRVCRGHQQPNWIVKATDVHSLPAMTKVLPLPTSSGALEIAASG